MNIHLHSQKIRSMKFSCQSIGFNLGMLMVKLIDDILWPDAWFLDLFFIGYHEAVKKFLIFILTTAFVAGFQLTHNSNTIFCQVTSSQMK